MPTSQTYRPEAPEIYAQTNGVMGIRAPIDGTKQWHSYNLHTSDPAKARSDFQQWLKKHKVTGIDASKVTINSRFGPLDGDGAMIAQIRRARAAHMQANPKANGSTNLPAVYDEAAARQREQKRKWSKTYYEKKKRAANGHASEGNTISRETAQSLIAVLAANLASAATTLKMLQEHFGGTSPIET